MTKMSRLRNGQGSCFDQFSNSVVTKEDSINCLAISHYEKMEKKKTQKTNPIDCLVEQEAF